MKFCLMHRMSWQVWVISHTWKNNTVCSKFSCFLFQIIHNFIHFLLTFKRPGTLARSAKNCDLLWTRRRSRVNFYSFWINWCTCFPVRTCELVQAEIANKTVKIIPIFIVSPLRSSISSWLVTNWCPSVLNLTYFEKQAVIFKTGNSRSWTNANIWKYLLFQMFSYFH